MTDDVSLGDTIQKTKPEGVELIDHIEARAIWSSLQLEREKRQALKELKQHEVVTPSILAHFEKFADRLAKVIKKRNARYLEIEKGLIEGERTLVQIIQGSTMPTFVIDKNHIVTHWNKAMERLSGTRDEAISYIERIDGERVLYAGAINPHGGGLGGKPRRASRLWYHRQLACRNDRPGGLRCARDTGRRRAGTSRIAVRGLAASVGTQRSADLHRQRPPRGAAVSGHPG